MARGLPGFTERFAKVNGVRLRFRIGGQGSPVVSLHGYAETGHMWRPIMALLAQRHTVVGAWTWAALMRRVFAFAPPAPAPLT